MLGAETITSIPTPFATVFSRPPCQLMLQTGASPGGLPDKEVCEDGSRLSGKFHEPLMLLSLMNRFATCSASLLWNPSVF